MYLNNRCSKKYTYVHVMINFNMANTIFSVVSILILISHCFGCSLPNFCDTNEEQLILEPHSLYSGCDVKIPYSKVQQPAIKFNNVKSVCCLILLYTYLLLSLVYGLWCLTSLSTIFDWYHGGQLYWREYPVKTTDLSQVTDKTLSHNVVSSTSRHQRGSNSQYLFLLTINCLLTWLMNRWNLSWFFKYLFIFVYVRK